MIRLSGLITEGYEKHVNNILEKEGIDPKSYRWSYGVMYFTNETIMKRAEAILSNHTDEIYRIPAMAVKKEEVIKEAALSNVRKLSGNWIEGYYDGRRFQAQVFSEPSKYGIDGGRVSRLSIWEPGQKNPIYHWERGADIDHPLGRELAAALEKTKTESITTTKKVIKEVATGRNLAKLKQFLTRAQKIEGELERLEMDLDDFDSYEAMDEEDEMSKRQSDWFSGLMNAVQYSREELTGSGGDFDLYNKSVPER